MKTGPLTPVSKKAMESIEKVARILQDVSEEEWLFVCKQAREKAGKILLEKLLGKLSKFFIES